MTNTVRQFLLTPDKPSLQAVLVQLVQTIAVSMTGPHRDHGTGNLFLPDDDEEDAIADQLRRELGKVVELDEDDLFDLANVLAAFDRTIQQLAAHRDDADRGDYEYVLRFFSLTPGYYLNAAATLAWHLDEFYDPSAAKS